MAKRVAVFGLLTVLVAFLLTACASVGDEGTSSGPSSQSAETVPGEKLSDERFAPGPTGSSGSVRW
jgi:starvation-inducible outer membrane lipoprotein